MRTVAIVLVAFGLSWVLVINTKQPWDVIGAVLLVILILLHRAEVRDEERKRHARPRVQEVLPPM